jgi:predicted phage tail protein
MTEVYLHGILGKKYGKRHKLALSKPRDLLFAMEANFDNFIKDLKDLSLKHVHYTFVVDDKWLKNNELKNLNKAQKIHFVPIINGGGPTAIAIGVSLAIAVASAIYSYVQAGKVEYPKVPGASASTNAFSKSLAFSNRENIAEQGNPIPLVYGRLKIGSYLIQSSVKSFPLSINLVDEFINNSNKKGVNQTAIITSVDYNNFANYLPSGASLEYQYDNKL